MFKIGVYTAESVSRSKSLFGRSRTVSLGLLRPGAQPIDGEFFQGVIRGLRLSDRVYRTTFPHRFASLDPQVNELIVGRLASSAAITVHDWAASDVLAAVEWAGTLKNVFPRLSFCASDKLFGLIEAFRDDAESYIFEPDGTPLQYTSAPFVIALREPEAAVYPVNRWLARRASRRAEGFRSIVPQLKWSSVTDDSVIERDGWQFRQILLIHPVSQRYLRENPWFGLSIHSVFDPTTERINVIRSMNIFNTAYFSSEQLTRGVRAVFSSLCLGGLWIVGKTDVFIGTDAQVTIWEARERGFAPLLRIGRGSEIDDLVQRTFRE